MENKFSQDEARKISETLGLEEPMDLWQIKSDNSQLKKLPTTLNEKFVQYLQVHMKILKKIVSQKFVS